MIEDVADAPADYDPAVDFDDTEASAAVPDQVGEVLVARQRANELAALYAFLSSLAAGVITNKDLIGEQMQQAYRAAGLVRGSEPTPFGSVAMAAKGGREEVEIADEEAFLASVEAANPDMIERKVNSAHRKMLLERRFAIRGGQVVDTETGEVVPYARVKTVPVGDPMPTHSASPAQQAAKMAATTFVAEQLAGGGWSAALLSLPAGLAEVAEADGASG